jgi:hypothetical protein
MARLRIQRPAKSRFPARYRSAGRTLIVLLAGAAALAGSARKDAGAPTDLSTLLRRAGEYSRSYHETLTTVVAEETYFQRASPTGKSEETRTLKSEFALVRGAPGENMWLAIRDVMEVDGRRIADHSRLNTLLTGTQGSLRSAARAIADEQAKYNLGYVYRTINVPTLTLEFLLPDRQRRFRFKQAGSMTAFGIDTTSVSFEERSRPTIIQTVDGRDVVSRGTVWIAPDGQVVKTELITAGIRDLRVVIAVTYEFEPRLNMLLPVTMHESYSARNLQITAVATYRNFRRFETDARIVR